MERSEAKSQLLVNSLERNHKVRKMVAKTQLNFKVHTKPKDYFFTAGVDVTT
jgi:hypothetical protein